MLLLCSDGRCGRSKSRGPRETTLEEAAMTLTRWSPVRDLAAVEVDRLHRMFELAFGEEPLARAAWVPAVDIVENANKDLVVKAELPEMKREDIKVSFENNVLTIEGERNFEKDARGEQYHRIERGYGAFRRSFT